MAGKEITRQYKYKRQMQDVNDMTTIPPLPEPGDQSPDDRRSMSRRFILQAREELKDGNRLQAGEKAWGAVAQYLKIIGEHRGWQHGSHRQLESIGRHIRAEYPDYGSEEFADALSDAYHKGHENFYDNRRSIDEIEETIEGVERALPVLESLASEAPRYFKINSNSQRRRLAELTENRELQIGDESFVGFSLRHAPDSTNGGGQGNSPA